MKETAHKIKQSTEKGGKIRNIESLRLIAIVAILMLHIFHSKMGWHQLNFRIPLYDEFFSKTADGQKGVDLFFILSGLFFYFGLMKNSTMEFGNFLKKKIIRMWPAMAFAVLLSAVFSFFGLAHFDLTGNIYALLFLNGTPLANGNDNISSWYCSSMLFVFILFFYLFKNFSRKTFWLSVGVGIYVCFAVMLQAKNFKINSSSETFGYIFHVGIMRAWCGIGLGAFIGAWYHQNADKIKQFVPSVFCFIAISILELLCLCFMVHYLMCHRYIHYNDLMFIIVFVVLATSFLCNKGYVSRALDLDIFPALAKYVYAIYITHQVVLGALKRGIWIPHRDFVISNPITNICLTFAAVIFVGILTYHLVEKPATKYLMADHCKENKKQS